MLTPDKQGIFCDWCGDVSRKKFTYFSCEFTKVFVDADVKETGPADIDKKHLNLDICMSCYGEIEKKVKLTLSRVHNAGGDSKKDTGFTAKAT